MRGDGCVGLELKRAWHDGTRELVFEPLEFKEINGHPVSPLGWLPFTFPFSLTGQSAATARRPAVD